jgi:predicted DNA-binding transcriptional regulator AlpA
VMTKEPSTNGSERSEGHDSPLRPADRPRGGRRRRPCPPLLVSIDDAAAMVALSTATFYRRLSAGEVGPVPLELGGRRLFRVTDLRRWVRLGLPDRPAWLALETARKDKRRPS